MNLCRCERGHFYDKEKYATCPHCAGGSAADETLTTAFTEDVTASVSGGGMQVAPGNAADVTEQVAAQGGFQVADIPADQVTVAHGMQGGDTPTVPLTNGNNLFEFTSEIPPTFGPTETTEEDHTIGIYDEFFETPDSTKKGPVRGKVQGVNKVSTPCVGWLIAMGGEHLGTDFRLKVGKNFIGRNADMDIALTEDKSVSRERQAIVVYEPKTHMYLVQPGEASSLVYRNNEVVLTPVKLEAYDVITVGDINLLFMPLCGERFNWGELFDEMKKNK